MLGTLKDLSNELHRREHMRNRDLLESLTARIVYLESENTAAKMKVTALEKESKDRRISKGFEKYYGPG
jgi:hypothetical protein